jgi:hypothetical protein
MNTVMNVYGQSMTLKYGYTVLGFIFKYFKESNFKVYNGSEQEPYTNPNAPIHIVTGSAVS